MGNHQVVPPNIEALRAENWVQAGQDQQNALFSNVNPYRRRLLANVITHELIEQYELNFITEQDYNSYIMQLSYRQSAKPSQLNNRNPQNFIYPIRFFVNKSKHEMCTTIHTGYLYTDKVDLRLKQINDIPFQDLLYMYKATLQGFKILYEKVGYFDIVEEMIFITRRGEVKVWMNANLAKNYPNYQKNSYGGISSLTTSEPAYSQREPENIYGSQADMIRKLILMIEKNSDELMEASQTIQNPQHHELFSEFLEDKNIFDKLSFQHSLEEFQSYLCQNNIHCPDYMKSIPELFAPEEFGRNPQFLSTGALSYDQSHVNEITSQHLTQMKKKFQPMETILEDQNVNGKSANIIQSNNQPFMNQRSQNKFHQSLVATYSQHAFSNNKQQPFPHSQNFSSQKSNDRRSIRPNHSPYTDLHNSRHSYMSNNVVSHSSNSHNNIEYGDLHNLQRSTNSQHNFNTQSNSPHPNYSKPSSVTTPMNTRSANFIQSNPHFQQQQGLHNNHPSFHQNTSYPSFNQQQQNLSNIPITGSPMIQYPFNHLSMNEMSQRVVVLGNSPPPSFRVMGGVSNGSLPGNVGNAYLGGNPNNYIDTNRNLQENQFKNLYPSIPKPHTPIQLPPPSQQQSNQINNSEVYNEFRVNQNPYIHQNNGYNNPQNQDIHIQGNNNSMSYMPPPQLSKNISNNQGVSNNKNNNASRISGESQLSPQNFKNYNNGNSNGNNNGNKIKYFTKTDTYQLDEEIATDLEKFLGLKVN